jgi:hypothetical protein
LCPVQVNKHPRQRKKLSGQKAIGKYITKVIVFKRKKIQKSLLKQSVEKRRIISYPGKMQEFYLKTWLIERDQMQQPRENT